MKKPGVAPVETVGVRGRVSEREYRAIHAVNFSTFKHADRSWAHYQEAVENPQPPTEDMMLGTLLHARILTPSEFPACYTVAPEADRRSKAGKEEWVFAANAIIPADAKELWTARWEEKQHSDEAFVDACQLAGMVMATVEMLAQVEKMAQSLLAHPAASAIIGAEGANEQVIVWRDPTYGILHKCRLDALRLPGVLADIKTTKDASPGAFRRSIGNFKYHWQACMYEEAVLIGMDEEVQMHIVALESEPPYGVAVYKLDQESRVAAWHKINTLRSEYLDCVIHDDWPGYSEDVMSLRLPPWELSGGTGLT